MRETTIICDYAGLTPLLQPIINHWQIKTIMLSGEIISVRAKKVLYPIFFIALLNFVLFAVRWQMTNDSGMTIGKAESGGYRLVEHGRVVYVSGQEYLLARIQGVSLVACFAALFIARAYFSHTGDLKKP